MAKHKAGHTDKTGGLPQNKTVRSVQDYQNKRLRKGKKK
jgi:hypothetical protein